MKARIALGGALVAGLALGGVAEAAPRVHEVAATPIYRRTFTLSAGSKTFSTSNLQSNSALACGTPDTVMVITRPDGIEVMNDDCNSSTKASCVTTSASAAGIWKVTVFADKPTPIVNDPGLAAVGDPIPAPLATHCGLADIRINSSTVDAGVTFGGIFLEPGVAGSTTAQTVHPPNGADDTTLLAYNGSWQELGYDNDGGVGKAAAKTLSLTTSSKVVVGSFSAASSGMAQLVLNDCTAVSDAHDSACASAGKDDDGDGLSDMLEGDLGTDPLHHDTDRDGIFDYYEAIGRKAEGGEQELRRYGANPRRRDLFVELDREINAAGTEATLFPLATVDAVFEDVFLDLPRLAPAPDGSHLIAIHVDVGAPCPTRPTLCGDWGGAVAMQQTFVETQAAGYPGFAGVRRGLFQYGYITTGGGGQAYGSTIYASAASIVPHELGHNLGLMHWGRIDQPQLNRKPNYPSLMNYAFSTTLPGVLTNRSRFSEGLLPSMDGAVDEATWDDNADARHMARDWGYTIQDGAIDFNRDGRRGGAVLADHAPLDRATTGDAPWPHTALSHDLDVTLPTGGAAIATYPLGAGSWLTTAVPSLHGPYTYPDLRYTFDDGSGGWWSAPQPAMDGAPEGEPAVAMYEDASHVVRTLLVFPGRDGRLRWRSVDMGAPGTGGWNILPGLPAGSIARNANLERIGGELVLIWRDRSRSDDEDNVMQARFTIATQTWSTPELQPLISATTPDLAVAPDGYVYVAYTDLDSNAIRFLRRLPGDLAWSPASITPITWQPDAATAEPRAKLALEAVPLRRSATAGFEDGSGQLHVVWAVAGPVKDDWFIYRAQRGGHLSSSGSTSGSWYVRRDGSADRPLPGHSVSTAMRGKDLVAAYSAISWGSGTVRAARVLPYLFGAAPGYTGLLDNNDAAIIATQMCTALWKLPDGGGAACRCNTGQACANRSASLEVELCEPE